MLFNCSLDKNAFCMSINPTRYEYLVNNFIFVGLRPPKLYKCVRWKNGSNMGCLLGHMSIIMLARTLDLPWVTIYEDDAYPRPDVLWMFEKIKQYVPTDCGLLKIGSSSIRRGHREINKFVFETKDDGVSFGSHAYIVKKECYDLFLNALEDARVPDVAMSYKYFKDFQFKSYGLFLNCMLFAQKNIDTDNIISCKGGQRYWYMHPTNFTGCTTGLPPPGFLDKLFEDDYKYVKPICVVINDNWKNKKKTATIDGNILKTKDETGRLVKIDECMWKVKWNNSDDEEYLKYDCNKTGTDFYKIIKKDELPYNYHKFLLCMTSYKRPMECMCQIHRFFNCTYSNFVMSVIVRGVDENIYNNQILPDVKKYIDSGRLVISHKPNDNFLKNIIQCVDQYKGNWDYFFKIDDDDWYNPDFLKIVNSELNRYDKKPVGGFCKKSAITKTFRSDNMIKSVDSKMSLHGGTIFCNYDIYKILKDSSDNLYGRLKRVYNKYNLQNMKYSKSFEFGRCEDHYMSVVLRYVSNKNKIPLVEIENKNMYSIYRVYDGVMPR